MRFVDLLIPRHRACCDAANDAHVQLTIALRKLAEAEHRAHVLDVQLSEQIILTDHLTEFLSVLLPDEL